MNEIVVSVPPAVSFLSVGLPLKISLTLDQQKVMYGTTLLGWKDHAWLVCEWPIQLGHDQRKGYFQRKSDRQEKTGGTDTTISFIPIAPGYSRYKPTLMNSIGMSQKDLEVNRHDGEHHFRTDTNASSIHRQ